MSYRKNYSNVSFSDKYGVRNEVSMGDDLLKSILTYTQSLSSEAHVAAKEIQAEMKERIEIATPIRNYSTHTQVVSKIVAHRNPPTVLRAVKQVKNDKYQPGTTKKSWKYLTTNNLFGGTSRALRQSRIGATLSTDTSPRTIYAIRNTTRWSIIHLLNATHDTVSHKVRYIESSKGSGFVTKVQEWGQAELDKRLSKIIEKKWQE